MRSYELAGLPDVPIALPVPLIVNLIPATQITQRPGDLRESPPLIELRAAPSYRTTDAESLRNHLFNGARDESGGPHPFSFHFAVDATAIYQLLPVNEVALFFGDFTSERSRRGITIQVCNGRGSLVEALRNVDGLVQGMLQPLRLVESASRPTGSFSELSLTPLLVPDFARLPHPQRIATGTAGERMPSDLHSSLSHGK